jgi:5-methylcytosine-specific restriction enzyme A
MFERGRPVFRRELHRELGGQWQGGISTPADKPIILLFTGEGGERYGYDDEWEPEGTFRYFGEGQEGDMQFVRGNRAIRDHAADGKELHLFQKLPRPRDTEVQYEGQFVCAGYEFVPNVPDRNGSPRTSIAFRLLPLYAVEATDSSSSFPSHLRAAEYPDSEDADRAPLEVLRQRALERPMEAREPGLALRTTYRRSGAVRSYVLRRADGVCEGCGANAPFTTRDGAPYLEPHHTRRLSDGGPDHPAHVIALCPNCHRRVHHAWDGEAFNEELRAQLCEIEVGTRA